MTLSIFVTPPTLDWNNTNISQPTSANNLETNELLRQMLELQKEQLQISKMLLSQNDESQRWKNHYQRWKDEFPTLPQDARTILPDLERTQLDLLQELADKLQHSPELLESEFSLTELIERYGVRLAQLGHMLNQIHQLAFISQSSES